MGKIAELLILMIIFSGIAVGFSTFYADVYTTYNSTASPGSTAFLNKTQEISGNVTNIKNVIDQSQVTGTILDVPVIIANSLFEAFKMMFSFIDIIDAMMKDISSVLMIPEWATWTISSIASVVILFAIISALTKWEL